MNFDRALSEDDNALGPRPPPEIVELCVLALKDQPLLIQVGEILARLTSCHLGVLADLVADEEERDDYA